MTPKQLSEKTGASMSAVSQKLTELERDKIVQSCYKNRRDRRRKTYFLTDKGKKIVDFITKSPPR
jgi:DNA-binding MarR family transcriptional regulator